MNLSDLPIRVKTNKSFHRTLHDNTYFQTHFSGHIPKDVLIIPRDAADSSDL